MLQRQFKTTLRVRDPKVPPVRPPPLRNSYTICKGSVRLNHNSRSETTIVHHQRATIKAQAAANFGDSSDTPAESAAGTAGRSTFIQAVFNVVNVMMGVGLLSLPFALKSSGWIGIGLLWLMGIVTNYTGLIRSPSMGSNDKLMSRMVAGQSAFSLIIRSHAITQARPL